MSEDVLVRFEEAKQRLDRHAPDLIKGFGNYWGFRISDVVSSIRRLRGGTLDLFGIASKDGVPRCLAFASLCALLSALAVRLLGLDPSDVLLAYASTCLMSLLSLLTTRYVLVRRGRQLRTCEGVIATLADRMIEMRPLLSGYDGSTEDIAKEGVRRVAIAVVEKRMGESELARIASVVSCFGFTPLDYRQALNDATRRVSSRTTS
jgi:hypothetical protein